MSASVAGGAIGGFTSQNGSEFELAGAPYRTQNGNSPWAVSNPQADILRFELRPGDTWNEDPHSKERTEVAGETVYAAGKSIKIIYDFMVEPGQDNTAEWLVIGQFHSVDDFSSPCLAVELIGEKIAIHLRDKSPGQPEVDWIAYIDDSPIIRGKYYHMELEIHFEDHEDAGAVRAWIDGELVVNYAGDLGQGYGTYWKEGIIALRPQKLSR